LSLAAQISPVADKQPPVIAGDIRHQKVSKVSPHTIQQESTTLKLNEMGYLVLKGVLRGYLKSIAALY
jgi:hypothetical protein